MTSSILIDASSVPAPQPPARATRRPAPASPQTFGGVLRSERIKLSSLRSIRLTLLITVLLGLGISALVVAMQMTDGFLVGSPDSLMGVGAVAQQSYLLFAATLSAPFLALVFGVLGVFAISNEYSSGMILSTLTAVPRRGRLFAAKALLLVLVAGATAAALVLGGLGLAVIGVPEAAGQLLTVPVISGVLGTVAYLVLITLFAFGVAALLRSTAGGIAVVAGVTFVLQIAFQVLTLTGWAWISVVSAYLPSPLGGVLSQGIGAAAAPASAIPAVGPGYWGALLAMVLWAAVALIPAAIAFQRRDAR